MSELTLHVDAGFISPWALTAFVALEEKRLPYTLSVRALDKKETFAADYHARTQRVPALQRGDFWLAESTAIAEYLAESFPYPLHPRLYPENLEKRGTCRELQAWLRTDLQALREERTSTTLWGARASKPLSDAAKQAAQRLFHVVAPLVGEDAQLDAVAAQRPDQPVPQLVGRPVVGVEERDLADRRQQAGQQREVFVGERTGAEQADGEHPAVDQRAGDRQPQARGAVRGCVPVNHKRRPCRAGLSARYPCSIHRPGLADE